MKRLLFCAVLVLLAACSAPTLRTNSISGQVEAYVPEGEFLIGQQADNVPPDLYALSPEKRWLPGYWISLTQVTNAQYRACERAGVCLAPQDAQRNPHYYDAEFDQHPVVYVSWYDAQSFCAWAGGRLPTEAEWEKAARGTQAQDYPWGNAEDVQRRAYVWHDAENETTVAVGSYPRGASPYGVLDMGGNVREWVDDWFDEERKALRGASWFDPPQYSLAFTRQAHAPESPGYNRGFRCEWDK